jgi:hypothetical protein
MSDNYKIIQLTTEDIPRISIFLGNNKASAAKNEDDWTHILEWMWLNNPSVSTSTKLGWGLEDVNGRIKGIIGNIPVKYKILNEEKSAIWGTSWYVSEDAKAFSLKMYTQFTRQSEIIFSNTQTPRVEIVMRKLGFKELPVEWFKSAYIFPLTIFTEFFLRNSINGMNVKKIGLSLFGLFTRTAQQIICKSYNNSEIAKGIVLEKIDRFPSETDQWFEEYSRDKDFIFIRNKKNYQWLFCQTISQERYLKYIVKYKQKTYGFLIFRKRKIKGFNFVEIIDEALLPLEEKVHRQLILKIISTLRQDDINYNFLIIRSNMRKSIQFFQWLGGVKYNRDTTGYFKPSLVKNHHLLPLITSIDGDSLFF